MPSWSISRPRAVLMSYAVGVIRFSCSAPDETVGRLVRICVQGDEVRLARPRLGRFLAKGPGPIALSRPNRCSPWR